jgi:hypothetical protein
MIIYLKRDKIIKSLLVWPMGGRLLGISGNFGFKEKAEKAYLELGEGGVFIK